MKEVLRWGLYVSMIATMSVVSFGTARKGAELIDYIVDDFWS